MRKLIAFHGFLGSPNDFDFLEKDFDIFCPNLDLYTNSSDLSTLIDDISIFVGEQRADVIGYSFGARLALQIYLDKSSSFGKLFLVAGHLGLSSENDRQDRRVIEGEFIKAIEKKSFDEFITFWNNLSLFKYDTHISSELRSRDTLRNYFLNFGLSKQKDYRASLIEHRDKVKWFFGDQDHKYCEYAKKELQDFDVMFIQGAGHRLIKSEIAQKLIKQEVNND